MFLQQEGGCLCDKKVCRVVWKGRRHEGTAAQMQTEVFSEVQRFKSKQAPEPLRGAGSWGGRKSRFIPYTAAIESTGREVRARSDTRQQVTDDHSSRSEKNGSHVRNALQRAAQHIVSKTGGSKVCNVVAAGR